MHRKLTAATFGKDKMANVAMDVIKHPSRMMSVEENELLDGGEEESKGDAIDEEPAVEEKVDAGPTSPKRSRIGQAIVNTFDVNGDGKVDLTDVKQGIVNMGQTLTRKLSSGRGSGAGRDDSPKGDSIGASHVATSPKGKEASKLSGIFGKRKKRQEMVGSKVVGALGDGEDGGGGDDESIVPAWEKINVQGATDTDDDTEGKERSDDEQEAKEERRSEEKEKKENDFLIPDWEEVDVGDVIGDDNEHGKEQDEQKEKKHIVEKKYKGGLTEDMWRNMERPD